MATETKVKWTKGSMKAAEIISRFTTLNSKNGVPWAAEVIDRETKAPQMAELLQRLVDCEDACDTKYIAEDAEKLLKEIES